MQATAQPTGRVEPGSGECGDQVGCGAPKAEGCGCGSDPAADILVRQTTDPATGKPIQAVGAKLSGAAPVTVRALLGNPGAFAGKTVRVEGDISAMCHRRRWFAVQDPGDRSGSFVRVLAAPAFLVPPASNGKKARAEGTVEVIEVPSDTREHLARDHGLGDTQGAPQRSVVLRATGAEII
jgi:hypothetical protein